MIHYLTTEINGNFNVHLIFINNKLPSIIRSVPGMT
jgi:hypothetical protein